MRDATCPRRELDERKDWWSNTWSRTQCLTGLNETKTGMMVDGLDQVLGDFVRAVRVSGSIIPAHLFTCFLRVLNSSFI